MNFGLSGEQQMIVDTVRSFVEKELYPHEAAVERTGAVPREIGQEIARKCLALGFFAANMPEEVGGADHVTPRARGRQPSLRTPTSVAATPTARSLPGRVRSPHPTSWNAPGGAPRPPSAPG